MRMIDTAGILGTGILVHRGATVLLWQKLLDLPIVLLDANTELEVLFCDRVPILQQTAVSETLILSTGTN